jgi:hypothetical protein
MSRATAMIQKSVNRFEVDVQATQTGLAMMTDLAMYTTVDRSRRRVQRPAHQIGIWRKRDRNNKHTLLSELINYANSLSLWEFIFTCLCKEVFGAKRDHAVEVEESINVNNSSRSRFFECAQKPIYIVLRTQQELNCLCEHSINYICVKYSEQLIGDCCGMMEQSFGNFKREMFENKYELTMF